MSQNSKNAELVSLNVDVRKFRPRRPFLVEDMGLDLLEGDKDFLMNNMELCLEILQELQEQYDMQEELRSIQIQQEIQEEERNRGLL